MVAEDQLVETLHRRAEAVGIAGVGRRIDGTVGAAVERAVEAVDVDPLGLAIGRMNLRAVFSAHSTASVPELVKKTTSANDFESHRASARASCPGILKMLETCHSFSA